MVAPSEESYSDTGPRDAPLIIEPPFWAYNALKELFDVPEEKKGEVAKEIKKAISLEQK